MDSSITSDQNFYAQSNLHHENNERADISGASSDLRGTDLPNNPQATNMTGYTNGVGADLVDSPDDFYKGFKGDLDSANGSITASTPASGQRISSTPVLGQNSNGTTAKYPVITGSLTTPKQSYRSVSAPMNDGRAKTSPALKGVPRGQQPSVRDLLKRFDPSGEQPSSIPRRTPPRQQAKSPDVSNRYRPAMSIQKQQPSIRPGQVTRDLSKAAPSRTTQRSRFAIEDQRSNNTLSSAARSPKARNQSGEFNASRSVTNLAISIVPPKPAATDASRKPLFGEIVPTESGSQIAYGISDPRSRARRTSDSSLISQSWSHRRSSSDVDVSPSSPTAWYLGVTPKLDDLGIGATPKHAKVHNRSQSDFTGFPAPSILVGFNEIAFMKSDAKTDEKSTPKSPTRSRLPISSKRTSYSSASSTPSTRSSSPFAAKMIASNKKDKSPSARPWSPPGHGTTSSRLSARGQGRSPAKISTNNASLNAYISSPPPMKSPPLRSSRPRQPVSAATTASSRSKVSESYSNRAETRIQEKARINRLASAGPVDYAAKRARIQQAFSKTIQETELKENDQPPPQEDVAHYEADPQSVETVGQHTEHAKEPKLVLDTNVSQAVKSDSPTLGMPGSFPRQQAEIDESPASAVSNATAVTLFDNELQTEPAKHHSTPSFPHQDPTPKPLSSQRNSNGSPEDYFDANDGSIQIVLDEALNGESQFPDFEDSQRQVMDDGHQLQPLAFVDNAQPSDQEAESTSFVRATSPHASFEPGSFLSDVQPENTAALSEVDHIFNEGNTTSSSDGAMQSDAGAFAPPTSWSSRHSSPSRSSLGLSKLNTLLSESPPRSPNLTPDIEGSPVTEIDYGSSESLGEDEQANQSINHERASQPSNWSDVTVDASNRSSWYANTNRSSGLFEEPSVPPPPPPKEPILPAKPDVPPKPANYEELFSPRPDGDDSNDNAAQFYSSMTDLTGINHTIKPPRSRSVIPPIPSASPWLAGMPSPPPPPKQPDTTHHTTRRRTPPPSSVWNRHPPPSLHRYSFKDPESRRVSGDEMYSYRPSTSTARSSAQISLEGDAAETSLSSTDHLSIDAPQTSDDGVAPEAVAAALRHRKMLIQELIDTEAVYLKDMNVVVEIYQGTAEACPKLGTGDIKAIFRNSDEVIAFSERFLADIKAASATIYIPRSTKSKQADAAKSVHSTDGGDKERPISLADDESDWSKDQKTTVGENFGRHIEEMEKVYANFLKNSEQGTNRLQSLQTDPTVNVWLEECNAVAKDLTGAWDLDALLVKPVQRITRYQLLMTGILKNTPELHPDYPSLHKSLEDIKRLLDNIDGQKKRIHKVNEIVTGRKRKESDIRSGLKNPFTRRERAETAVLHDRANEDQEYLKYCDKFHSEWIHLQFIIRDIDLYLENVTRWVDDFLRYLSAIELVVRASPSNCPELESKWARFNLSMRDVGKIALEEHVSFY